MPPNPPSSFPVGEAASASFEPRVPLGPLDTCPFTMVSTRGSGDTIQRPIEPSLSCLQPYLKEAPGLLHLPNCFLN